MRSEGEGEGEGGSVRPMKTEGMMPLYGRHF